MVVMAANFRHLAIFCVISGKKQALLRNQSVRIAEQFSLGQLREMDILHRANARRSANSNSNRNSSSNRATESVVYTP